MRQMRAVLQHDGPNHLGLRSNGAHQPDAMALDTSGCGRMTPGGPSAGGGPLGQWDYHVFEP